VLWQCWLGVRKSNRPVKIEWWGVGVVICLERGADCLQFVYGPAEATASQYPHHLLPQLNPDWSTYRLGQTRVSPRNHVLDRGCTLAPAGEYELANDSCTAAMRVRIKVRWSFYAKIGNRYFITSHLLIPLIVSCDRSWQSQLILCPVDWRMKSFSYDEWTRLNCKCPHAPSNCIESGTVRSLHRRLDIRSLGRR